MRKILWGGLVAATAAAFGGLVLVGVHAAHHPECWAGRGVSLALGLGGRAVTVPQAAHATVAAAHGPVAGPCLGCIPCEPPILACESLPLTPLPAPDEAGVAAQPCSRGSGAAPACLAGRIVIDETTALSYDGPAAAMPAVRDGAGERWATGAEESDAGAGTRSRETPAAFALMPHVEDDEAAPGAAALMLELLPAPAVREPIAAPAEAGTDDSQTRAAPAPAGGMCPRCEAEPGQPHPVPHLPVPHLQEPCGCPSSNGSCPSVPRTIKGREGHSGLEEYEPAGRESLLPRLGGVDTLEFRPCDRSLSAVDLRGPF